MEMLPSKQADHASYIHAYQKMEKNDPGALDAFRNLSGLFNDDPLVSFHLNRLKKGESGATVIMDEK